MCVKFFKEVVGENERWVVLKEKNLERIDGKLFLLLFMSIVR